MPSWTASIGRARASRTSSVGARPAMCAVGAGADPDDVVREQRALHQHALDARERERRDRARREAGRRLAPRSAPASAQPARSRRARATLAPSARRSPGTSTTTGRPSQSKTSDLTICASSQPIGACGVARGRRPLGELLQPCLGAGLAQVAGDALHRLGPVRHRDSVASGGQLGRPDAAASVAVSMAAEPCAVERFVRQPS